MKISRWFNRDQLHCLLIGSDGGREQWSVLIWFQCECPAGLYSCVYSLHSSRSRCCCSRLPASTAQTKVVEVIDPPVVPLFCARTPDPKIQSKIQICFGVQCSALNTSSTGWVRNGSRRWGRSPYPSIRLLPPDSPPRLTSPQKAEDGALAGATYISNAYTSTTSSNNMDSETDRRHLFNSCLYLVRRLHFNHDEDVLGVCMILQMLNTIQEKIRPTSDCQKISPLT